MPTTEERLGIIETKIDYLTGKVLDHITMHSGDKERIAVIEQRLADDQHRQDSRLQKALVWATVVGGALFSLIGGLVGHFVFHI